MPISGWFNNLKLPVVMIKALEKPCGRAMLEWSAWTGLGFLGESQNG